jgi:hypothetical protein
MIDSKVTRRVFLRGATVLSGGLLVQAAHRAAPIAVAADEATDRRDAGLIGHWPLAGDLRDHSSLDHATRAVDVELGQRGPRGKPATAARFNGRSSLLEVPDHSALKFDQGDLSLAAWLHTDERNADIVGNILSKFDTRRRTDLQLYVLTNDGVTSTATANSRQLSFGIDDGRSAGDWTDCGRPGNAVKVAALSVVNGDLYAGTLETSAQEKGHLWRYAGGQQWIDLGNPLGANVVHSVTEFEGRLYCGVGRYNCSGSALGETLNTTPGGKVFCVDPGGTWGDCGHPGLAGATLESTPTKGYASGKADDVFDLTVYRGELYCVSNHRRNVFKYEGVQNWKNIGLDHRVLSLKVYRDKLYALINGGPVYCYEGGSQWTLCGCPKGSTQTYGGIIYAGQLYVGTWPRGEVFRWDGGQEWVPVGRLGQEQEIMAMVLYNGKAYAGTLPLAEVYRYEESGQWTLLRRLDLTPDVRYRRVWSMATYQGQLFAGTLPTGRVWSLRAGAMVTWDRRLPGGWRHVAAVKDGRQLRLFLDGKEVADTSLQPGVYNLSNQEPLQIGFGAYEHFDGLMSDVRLYNRALSAEEMAVLARI